MPSTRDQSRFTIQFAQPKTVDGFSVGGILFDFFNSGYYSAHNCHANCFLIEGRESDADFWQPFGEFEFDPAERRTRYFDFPVSRVVGQLRITVQDVAHRVGATQNSAVHLPPMQFYGG